MAWEINFPGFPVPTLPLSFTPLVETCAVVFFFSVFSFLFSFASLFCRFFSSSLQFLRGLVCSFVCFLCLYVWFFNFAFSAMNHSSDRHHNKHVLNSSFFHSTPSTYIFHFHSTNIMQDRKRKRNMKRKEDLFCVSVYVCFAVYVDCVA